MDADGANNLVDGVVRLENGDEQRPPERARGTGRKSQSWFLRSREEKKKKTQKEKKKRGPRETHLVAAPSNMPVSMKKGHTTVVKTPVLPEEEGV